MVGALFPGGRGASGSSGRYVVLWSSSRVGVWRGERVVSYSAVV